MSAIQSIASEVQNVVPIKRALNKTDINTHTVLITRFEDATAQTKRKGEHTLPDWRDHILHTTAPSKGETPWLKLAIFGDNRSAKGSQRTNANVIEITGVECDYDDEQISFDEAMEIMRSAGVRCLLYTSASHSPEKPRWRILTPFSKNHPPTSHASMVGRLNGLFGGALASESFVLSTSYHYGSVNNSPHHRAEVLDGEFLNLCDRLHAGSIDKNGHRIGHKDFEQPKSSAGKPNEPGNEFLNYNPNSADKDLIVAALAVIDADCGHRGWYKIGCAIRFELGDDGEDVFHEWSATAKAIYKRAECDKKWSETKGNTHHRAGTIFYLANLANPNWRESHAQDALARDCEDNITADTDDIPPKAITKPKIQVINGKLSENATAGEVCLIAAGLPLYQRNHVPVRPIIETVDASHGRETRIAQLKTIEPNYLRDLLCRTVTWQRFDGRAKRIVEIDAPKDIAATILARSGEWKFPVLAGVISTPTMRADGSLLTTAGYDEKTRLLLVEPPPMPTIPDAPTREDAAKALALIEELLTEFPFIDEVAKAVALAGIITPIARGAFSVSPMFASNAPVPGSGKSFLWDIVGVIAIGQLMPVMAAGASEEETEKRLGSALMTGQPLINIDNIVDELRGVALCQCIERPVVDIRILGKSESKRIEARGTTIYGSGNNLVVRGDLCRRVLTTTLDPRVERPELRQFKGDPVATVLANRGLYIAAGLTICKAYIAEGRPNLAPKLASFEGWSDTVRSALIWLGKADPIASMELSHADDPERLELGNLLTAWGDAIGVGPDHRCTLATVIEKATKMVESQYNPSQKEPEFPELLSAVTAAAYSVTQRRGQKIDAATLGLYTRGLKRRVIDGKRFQTKSNPKGRSLWWIEQVSQPEETNQPEETANINEATGGATLF